MLSIILFNTQQFYRVLLLYQIKNENNNLNTMKNNTSLKILKKNTNNKYKLILFNKKIKDSGEIKHFPAYFNE